MVISVIIVTFNRCAFLKKCLKSLIDQTVLPDEIIVVDNGSSDNTKQIIDEFINNRSVPINYIFKQRGGISSGRNSGLKHAIGDIVAFTDDDCLVCKDWIKNIKDAHIKYPQASAIGGRIENAYAQPLGAGIGSGRVRLGLGLGLERK